MNNYVMIDIAKKAIEKWGMEPQMDMAIEELSELIQAVCKVKRTLGNDSELSKRMDNLYEEIADVEIMICQLKEMFNCTTQVDTYKNSKIIRLEKRIGL